MARGVLDPVLLSYNNYFVLEGFNAHNSKATVVSLSHSNHNIVRRVAAWDAADNNTNIFGIHVGTHNLLEDVAGWGIARKIFSVIAGRKLHYNPARLGSMGRLSCRRSKDDVHPSL